MSTGNLSLPRSWRDSFKNDSVRGVSMAGDGSFYRGVILAEHERQERRYLRKVDLDLEITPLDSPQPPVDRAKFVEHLMNQVAANDWYLLHLPLVRALVGPTFEFP